MLMSCDIYVVFISCHGSWADFFLLSLFTLLCFCHSKLSHTALLGNNLDISYSGNTDKKKYQFSGNTDLEKYQFSGNTILETYNLPREYRLGKISVTQGIKT